jgi:hypothetical protein
MDYKLCALCDKPLRSLRLNLFYRKGRKENAQRTQNVIV